MITETHASQLQENIPAFIAPSENNRLLSDDPPPICRWKQLLFQIPRHAHSWAPGHLGPIPEHVSQESS